MSATVLIPIAQGTDEIEAIVAVNLLRRANVYVRVAGENEIVTCSKGTKIIPDILIDSLNSDMEFTAIVLPGGRTGTLNLLNNSKLQKLLEKHSNRGGIIASICAAPSILTAHKIFPKDAAITSHPTIKDMFEGYNYSEERVVVAGNFITSRGVGTSIDFTLKLIEILVNKETADNIAADIVWR